VPRAADGCSTAKHRGNGGEYEYFCCILVGEDGTIEGAELTTVYAALATWEPDLGKPRHLTALPSPAKGSNKKNPGPVFRGQGSHNDILVELVGIEPTTSAMPWRRSPS
jgi:hypothetical protein